MSIIESRVGFRGEFTVQVIRRGKVISETKTPNQISNKWLRSGLTTFLKNYNIGNNAALHNLFYEGGYTSKISQAAPYGPTHCMGYEVSQYPPKGTDNGEYRTATLGQGFDAGRSLREEMVQAANGVMRVDYFMNSGGSQNTLDQVPQAKVRPITTSVNGGSISAPSGSAADTAPSIGLAARNNQYFNQISNLYAGTQQTATGVWNLGQTVGPNEFAVVSLWSGGFGANSDVGTPALTNHNGDPGTATSTGGAAMNRGPEVQANTMGADNLYFPSASTDLQLPNDDPPTWAGDGTVSTASQLLAYATRVNIGTTVVYGDEVLVTYKLVPSYTNFGLANGTESKPTSAYYDDGGMNSLAAAEVMAQMHNGISGTGANNGMRWSRLGIYHTSGNATDWGNGTTGEVWPNTMLEFGASGNATVADYIREDTTFDTTTGYVKGDQEVRIGRWQDIKNKGVSCAMTKSLQSLTNTPLGAWVAAYGGYKASGTFAQTGGDGTAIRTHDDTSGTYPTFLSSPQDMGNFVVKYPEVSTSGPTANLGFDSGTNSGKRHSLTFILKFQNTTTPWYSF